MTTLRKDVHPYNKQALKRNGELRLILKHLERTPGQTLTAIAKELGITVTKARNALCNLVNYNLAYVSRRGLSVVNTPLHYYSAYPFSPSDLTEKLPVVPPPKPPIEVPREPTLFDSLTGKRLVRRDPLVAAIHGHGRAPSLNFMNSNRGAFDAQSQTTIKPN
jgi:hypothetical protein